MRTALALGLVWLGMPHQPDVGLPQAPAIRCDADIGCGIGATDQQRDAIFQRLRTIHGVLTMAGPAATAGAGRSGAATPSHSAAGR